MSSMAETWMRQSVDASEESDGRMGTKSLKKSASESVEGPDELPPKRIKHEMLNLRMDKPSMEWLREVSEKKGVGVSTLARMWVLERLAHEGPPKKGPWV